MVLPSPTKPAMKIFPLYIGSVIPGPPYWLNNRAFQLPNMNNHAYVYKSLKHSLVEMKIQDYEENCIINYVFNCHNFYFLAVLLLIDCKKPKKKKKILIPFLFQYSYDS